MLVAASHGNAVFTRRVNTAAPQLIIISLPSGSATRSRPASA